MNVAREDSGNYERIRWSIIRDKNGIRRGRGDWIFLHARELGEAHHPIVYRRPGGGETDALRRPAGRLFNAI